MGDLTQEEFRSIKGQLVERLADGPVSGSDDSDTSNGNPSETETSEPSNAEDNSVNQEEESE